MLLTIKILTVVTVGAIILLNLTIADRSRRLKEARNHEGDGS